MAVVRDTRRHRTDTASKPAMRSREPKRSGDDVLRLLPAIPGARSAAELWPRYVAATRPDTEELTHAEVRAAVRAVLVLREQQSVREAAELFGVSHQHLTLVLGGQRIGSKRLRACIAALTGLHINAVPRTPAPGYELPPPKHPPRRRHLLFEADD